MTSHEEEPRGHTTSTIESTTSIITPTISSASLPTHSTPVPTTGRNTPSSFTSFRNLVNRDGFLPLGSDHTTAPVRLLEVVGLDRGRLTFEGVYLNAMCSLKRLGLRNVSGKRLVVRLGSTVGDQLRWQLRNDNLDSLPVELQQLPTNTVASIAKLNDLPESNAMFDSVGLISEVILRPGETKSIVAAFRPDSTHFQPAVINYESSAQPGAATGVAGTRLVDTYSEQGLSSISIAESSLSSASALGENKPTTTFNLATIDGYLNFDASLLPDIASDDLSSFSASAKSSTRDTSPPAQFTAVQSVSIEFHATCCRSFFRFTAKDSANVSYSSDDEIYVDFGSCRVGEVQTRECEILNRSAIELFWRIENSAPPFQIEDIESGKPISSEAIMAVAPYSSRRLRVHFRPSEAHEADTEMTFENVADPDNTVVVHFHATVSSAPRDNSLRLVSGSSLDFGDCCTGAWSQQAFSFTNTSEAPLEVAFNADKGYEVTFRLESSNHDEDVAKILELDHSAIKANAVEPALGPSTPDVTASDSSSSTANMSRTIIHELARSTTTSSAPRPTPLIVDPSARTLIPTSTSLVTRSSRSGTLSEQGNPNSTVGSDIVVDSPISSSEIGKQAFQQNREYPSPLSAHPINANEVPLPSLEALTSNGSATTEDRPKVKAARAELPERGLFRVQDRLKVLEQRQSASVDQMHAKPGVIHRIIVTYRPTRATSFEEDGGRLHKKSFKVHVSWRPWGFRAATSASANKERISINCKARVCSSFISIHPTVIDFGEVELGSNVQGTLSITNLSEITARVDLRFISKVLSAYRDEIEIEVGKTVDLKLDMVPRRTNPSYQKQVSVHNLLNPENSQVCLVKAVNVDTRGVAFHSLFYRLLTPTGGNFLEFGNVPINSTSLRAFTIQNTSSSALALKIAASHPEDYQILVRKTNAHTTPAAPTSEGGSETGALFPISKIDLTTISCPAPELVGGASTSTLVTAPRAPSSTSSSGTSKKVEIDALILQLKEGDKGKATQSYGHSVGFRDRSLLADAEYLDLASGPPVVTRRGSPRASKISKFDARDRSQSRSRLAKLALPTRSAILSKGLLPPLIGEDSTASETSPTLSDLNGVTSSASESGPPTTPGKKKSGIRRADGTSTSGTTISPALTGRRRMRNVLPLPTDPSQLSLEEVLTAFENHSTHPDTAELNSWEVEDVYVRKYIAMKKTLKNAVASGELVEIESLQMSAASEKTVYILVHPRGSRSNVQGSSRKQDGKIAIHLSKFDESIIQGSDPRASCLPSTSSVIPVRELVLRWTTCRSTMDLGMAHINFGQLEKSSSKPKKIVISNNSEMPLLYAVRKSGSIASGDLRLAEGRQGVIAGYGKREVSIVFQPHFAGAFEETIHVDNVEDETEGQTIRVKAFILRPPTFAVSTHTLDFGECAVHSISNPLKVSVTNVSKSQRTFSVSVDSKDFYFSRTALDVVLDPSATTSKVRGPLSSEEEEEVEGVLQKLKISRRKGQPEKEQKYIDRLKLLGVAIPPYEPGQQPNPSTNPSTAATTPVDEDHDKDLGSLPTPGEPAQAGTLLVVEGGTSAETISAEAIALSPSDSLPLVAAAASAYGKNKTSLSESTSSSSIITFTLEPSSQRDLAIVIIPRPVYPAPNDGQLMEEIAAPITVSENADSKVVVTLKANILLGR